MKQKRYFTYGNEGYTVSLHGTTIDPFTAKFFRGRVEEVYYKYLVSMIEGIEEEEDINKLAPVFFLLEQINAEEYPIKLVTQIKGERYRRVIDTLNRFMGEYKESLDMIYDVYSEQVKLRRMAREGSND